MGVESAFEETANVRRLAVLSCSNSALQRGSWRMTGRVLYFAYGSNMAIERLKARVPSAELVCIADLAGHQLKFHKRSKRDQSGKCDAAYTGSPQDKVTG